MHQGIHRLLKIKLPSVSDDPLRIGQQAFLEFGGVIYDKMLQLRPADSEDKKGKEGVSGCMEHGYKQEKAKEKKK